MGKSTIAKMFAALGFPVFDADAAVRGFYESGGAALIAAAFPASVTNGVVDRATLASRVLVDPSAIMRLEAIVHPEVQVRQIEFLRDARDGGRQVALLDIPLLFETGAERSVDLAIVVSASLDNQRLRVLSRAGMSASKFELILCRQIPDRDKRKRAHFVIDTNESPAESAEQVAGLVRTIADLTGKSIRYARNRT
jgi:dephospho-CoA kinase